MLDEYTAIRTRLVAEGYGHEIEWAQTVKAPRSAAAFVGEAIWVVCCSGFKEQRARVTQARVMAALEAGRSAKEVFPTSGKGRAIDDLWRNQRLYFREFRALQREPSDVVIGWIADALPYVGGPILRYHFAKNVGIDCAKPDVHLTRIARHHKTTPDALCADLARATGDRVATVDLVLWRASNLGWLNTREMGETR